MYCKKCGKKIADDSAFCSFCGTKVLEPIQSIEINNSDVENKSIVDEFSQNCSAHKSAKSSSIADEFIANFKMIGYAAIVWVVYMGILICFKQNDRKPMNENSWYGESCYDTSMSGVWIMDWERQYALEVLHCPDYSKKKTNLTSFEELAFSINTLPVNETDFNRVIVLNTEDVLNYANDIAKKKKIPQQKLDELKESAIDSAKEEKERFWEEITDRRISGYKNDLNNHMKWAAILGLSIMVLGRYIIKFIKWLAKNKSV